MRRDPHEAEKVLDMASAKAEAAEVWCVDSERIPVRFEDNKMKMLELSSSTGMALRVIAGGRIGFAASTKAGAGTELVDKALATAEFGTEADFAFAELGQYPAMEIHDPAVVALTAESMTQTGGEILEKILAYDPEIKASVSLDRGVGQVRLLSSRGLDLNRQGTHASILCWTTLVEGESLLRTGDMVGSRYLYKDPMEIADRTVEQIAIGRKAASIASGKYPVVFSPWALGDILRPVLACVDGDAVSRGVSPWRERRGEYLADERLSIYDDGLMQGGLGTAPWDDEGVASQCTPIIEDGVLKSFLLDLRNSGRLNLPPTGNGQRGGLTSVPGVGTTNIRVEPGDTPYREMLASIDEGILVHQLMGAWGSNPYGGQVSGNIALGFKIEKGELVGRVKDCMLYLNAFEAWRDQLSAISSEVRQVLSYSYPHVLIDGVSVSAGD